MFRRVVHGEPFPQPATFPVAKAVDERLGAMGVEVVHQQVNGLGRRMGLGDPLERLGKLRCLAIGRGVSVMATALGLDNAEDVRGAAALVFIVAACDLARAIGIPGRTESSSCTGRSSRATTGARGSAGWLRMSNTSSIRWTYSWSSFGTHHIFFPPRL